MPFHGQWRFPPLRSSGLQVWDVGTTTGSGRRESRTSWAGHSVFCKLAGLTVGNIDPPHGGGTLTSRYQIQ